MFFIKSGDTEKSGISIRDFHALQQAGIPAPSDDSSQPTAQIGRAYI
jgi:hypothetical protein